MVSDKCIISKAVLTSPGIVTLILPDLLLTLTGRDKPSDSSDTLRRLANPVMTMANNYSVRRRHDKKKIAIFIN